MLNVVFCTNTVCTHYKISLSLHQTLCWSVKSVIFQSSLSSVRSVFLSDKWPTTWTSSSPAPQTTWRKWRPVSTLTSPRCVTTPRQRWAPWTTCWGLRWRTWRRRSRPPPRTSRSASRQPPETWSPPWRTRWRSWTSGSSLLSPCSQRNLDFLFILHFLYYKHRYRFERLKGESLCSITNVHHQSECVSVTEGNLQ